MVLRLSKTVTVTVEIIFDASDKSLVDDLVASGCCKCASRLCPTSH